MACTNICEATAVPRLRRSESDSTVPVIATFQGRLAFRVRTAGVLLCAAIALAAAGCGDAEPDPGTETPAVDPPPVETVDLVAEVLAFRPNDLRVYKADRDRNMYEDVLDVSQVRVVLPESLAGTTLELV